MVESIIESGMRWKESTVQRMQQMETERDHLRSTLEQVQQELEQAQQELEQAQQELEQCQVETLSDCPDPDKESPSDSSIHQ